MNKNLASVRNGVPNKSIADSEELLCILFGVIVEIDIQICEIFMAFGVFFGSYIQNVGNARLKQILGFKSGHEIAKVQSRQHLYQIETL